MYMCLVEGLLSQIENSAALVVFLGVELNTDLVSINPVLALGSYLFMAEFCKEMQMVLSI